MSGASAGWRIAAAIVLAGCAAAAPTPEGDSTAAARRIALQARDAQVVYLGESHDNPHHHRGQVRVLEDMLAGGARPALAFEMLFQDQQPSVDDAMRGGADGAALAERLGWIARGWPDFEMYRPLFDLARRYQLPVVALDLDQQVVRRVAKEGLGALPPAERSLLASRLGPDPDRERGIARDIEIAHCGLLPAGSASRMVDAWHARNVTMARGILRALERAPQVVVIVGRGHQEPGGLAGQVEAIRPGIRQLVVDFVEVGTDGPGPAAPGDHVVWATPAVERPDPCAPLRSR